MHKNMYINKSKNEKTLNNKQWNGGTPRNQIIDTLRSQTKAPLFY